MKNLLFVIVFLFLVSCNDQGSAYKNSKKELSVELYSKIDSGQKATVHIEDKYMYVKTKEGVYKTEVVSESDLATFSLGEILITIFAAFSLGCLWIFLIKL